MKTFKEFFLESVGKLIGGDNYVHASYEHTLPQDELNKAKSYLPKGFQYHVVKHNKKSGAFSFIQSHDFDTANEPTVGDSIKVHPNGDTKITKMSNPPKVYHHKHQWVSDDYGGFDVNKSKARSKEWQSKLPIDSTGRRAITSRIGSKTYWHDWLENNGLKP